MEGKEGGKGQKNIEAEENPTGSKHLPQKTGSEEENGSAEERLKKHAEMLESQMMTEQNQALGEDDLEEKLRRQEEENSELRIQIDELKGKNYLQAGKIDGLNANVNRLKEDLQKKVDEMESILETQGAMGLLLRDMDSITVQSIEQENQIASLKQRSETLENRLKNKCAQLDEMDANMEERKLSYEKQIQIMESRNEIAHQNVKDTSSKLEETTSSLLKTTEALEKTKAKLDDAKARILDSHKKHEEESSLLKTQLKMLKKELKHKNAELDETQSSLMETKGQMDVLLRNLDAVTLRNVEHVKQINALKGSVLSLSTSMNGFFVAHDTVNRMMTEQSKALSLVLEKPEEILDQIADGRERMANESIAIERAIQSADPTVIEGVVWEHYVPPNDQQGSLVGSPSMDSTLSTNDSSSDDHGAKIDKQELKQLWRVSEAEEEGNPAKGSAGQGIETMDSCDTSDSLDEIDNYEQMHGKETLEETREPFSTFDGIDDRMDMCDGEESLDSNKTEEQNESKEAVGNSVVLKGEGTKDTLKLAPSDGMWGISSPRSGKRHGQRATIPKQMPVSDE